MSNFSISNESTWTSDDIDNLWRNINRAPSDPVAHWVSIASFLFAILGLISNSLSVIVLTRLSAQLSTFVYLSGLSLSDMLTCLSIVMTYLLDLRISTLRSTTMSIILRYVEIVFGAVAAGSRTLSLWISTAVTMDRWIMICHPIYAKTFCTLNRARVITRTFFVIALFYSIPLCLEYEIVRVPNPFPTLDLGNESLLTIDDDQNVLITKGYSNLARLRLYRWAYVFFNIIFVYTLPTITIIGFNLQLIRALHRVKSRAKRLGKSSGINGKGHRNQSRSSQVKYSVTLMVITMVLTLLLCRSPTIVLWLLWSFDLTIKIFFDASSSSLVRRFHNIANLIAIINAATNFLPFCVFGQLFRTECLNIYCCRKLQQGLLSPSLRGRRNMNSHCHGKTANIINQQLIRVRNENEGTVETNSCSSSKDTIRLHDVLSPNTRSEDEQATNVSATSQLLHQTNGL
ncbi:unnamed protein product [Adineta ricciae]|uniref:G-protein coupled receptors family 1 profile domain-containing protein n=1 Tax=Adineta ricciae TaxID=249248 RepID=A0A815Y264_ADIRI|nr:unnamed protein product [Adineta ricciae]CAF1564656.1 unnamed protein product [Adineta ricciae]